MNVFNEKDLYEYANDESGYFRILYSDEFKTYTARVDTGKDIIPIETSTFLLQDLLTQGQIKKVEDPKLKIIQEDQLSKKQKNQRKLRYKVINKYWSNPNEKKRFLEKSRRKGLYKEIGDELGISSRSVRTLISSFFKGGMTPNSLIPNFKQRGGNGRERRSYENSGLRLANSSNKSEEGLNITEVEREQFREAYEKVVLKEGKKITDAYDYLLKKYYSRIITDEAGNKRAVFIKKEPSERQFRYWLEKHREKDKEVVSVRGEGDYDNNYRVDMGSTRENINGPGNLMEIDLMHCNITVVSEQDRNLIIGRPSLYTIIDVFSGMVTGLYLGIEKESWRTTAFTLMNLIEDKVVFCKKNGIEIQKEDWPSSQLPITIKADKGGLNSPKVKVISNSYGVDFQYARSYTPRQKPNIEHRHKGYQDYIESHLEKYGADQWNSGERGVVDARENACLTLNELRKIIIKLTLKFNKTINNSYPRTPQMLADCVSPSPVELWQWGLDEGLSTLNQVSNKEEFRLCLLEHSERIIREKGIQINKHYYVPADLETARIFNQNKGKTVTVIYNQEDITEVYLLFRNKSYRLKMKDICDDYRGMSVAEDRILRKRALSLEKKKKSQERLEQIGLDAYVEELVKDKDKLIPTNKSERRQRVKKISQNQEDYIRNLKREESLDRDSLVEPIKEVESRQEEDTSFNERRWEFIRNALREIEQGNSYDEGS